MKRHKHLPNALKLFMLLTSALTVRKTASQQINAFTMKTSESGVTPWTVIDAGDPNKYDLISFNYKYEGIWREAILAFTVEDPIIDDRLICKEEDCCEARDYSYEDFDYPMPSCKINDILNKMIWYCDGRSFFNLTIAPSNKTVTKEMLTENHTSACSFYTIYSQSNIPSSLESCLENSLYDSTSSYCNIKEPPTYIPLAPLSAIVLYAATHVCALKTKAVLKKCSNAIFMLTPLMLCTTETLLYIYTLVDLNLGLRELISEYYAPMERDFEVPGAALSTTVLLIVIPRLLQALLSSCVSCNQCGDSLNTCTTLFTHEYYKALYAFAKGVSMFYVSLEFLNSHGEPSNTDDADALIAFSVISATLSSLRTLIDLRFLDTARLSKCGDQLHRTVLTNKKECICAESRFVNLILSSTLIPIVLGSFISTFSSMTITAGSNNKQKAISYLALIALAFWTNILGEESERLKMVFEIGMTFMEYWTFMRGVFLRIMTIEQPISKSVYYNEVSNTPSIFSALMALSSVLYMLHQLSVSKFMHIVQHKRGGFKLINTHEDKVDQEVLAALDIEKGEIMSTLTENLGQIKKHLVTALSSAMEKPEFYSFFISKNINPEYNLGHKELLELKDTIIKNMSQHVLDIYIEYLQSMVINSDQRLPPGVILAISHLTDCSLRIWEMNKNKCLIPYSPATHGITNNDSENENDAKINNYLALPGDRLLKIEPTGHGAKIHGGESLAFGSIQLSKNQISEASPLLGHKQGSQVMLYLDNQHTSLKGFTSGTTREILTTANAEGFMTLLKEVIYSDEEEHDGAISIVSNNNDQEIPNAAFANNSKKSRIYACTLAVLLLSLFVSTFPFGANLDESFSILHKCLSEYRDTLHLNCTTECNQTGDISVQDIGSSWFILACLFSIAFIAINQCVANHRLECQSTYQWVHSILFVLLGLCSFGVGGHAYISASNLKENYKNDDCTGDGPFGETKHLLNTAGGICMTIGGLSLLPIAIRLWPPLLFLFRMLTACFSIVGAFSHTRRHSKSSGRHTCCFRRRDSLPATRTTGSQINHGLL